MSATRDPRVDPWPGDVVRAASGMVRTVTFVDRSEQPRVKFDAYRMGVQSKRSESLQRWRTWCARNATHW